MCKCAYAHFDWKERAYVVRLFVKATLPYAQSYWSQPHVAQ